MAGLLACAPLMACASGGNGDAELRERMTTLFTAVYEEVADVHIDPLNGPEFTLAGLRGLGKLQPGLAVAMEDRTLTVSIEGAPVVEAPLPAEDAAPEDWARFARDAVLEARADGDLLATAGEEELNTRFFDSAMRSLDRFSRYADPEDAVELKAEREGSGGIGVDLESHPEGARIAGVDPNRPAEAAGLLTGDRIVAVDGEAVAGAPLRRVEKLLRGPVDEPVLLVISRSGLPEPLEIQVGRTRIVPDTIFLTRIGDHALIRISGFNERTSKRLSEAVAQARGDVGDTLDGIILDLRGNPGGLLEQAVDSADLFLDAGLISRADGRHPESGQRFQAEPGDIAKGIPLIVLVNGASASAAEILGAALQDNGRAVLIGMNTFGKGTIQTVIDLPNGGELYVTWARFVAPSGYALQRLGVMPTICTSRAEDAVVALETGLSDSDADGGRALLEARRTVDAEDEAAVRALLKRCPWRPHASGDIDLTIAELLLDSPALLRRALEISGGGDGV
jgi:carboxyl-terminal processing protease